MKRVPVLDTSLYVSQQRGIKVLSARVYCSEKLTKLLNFPSTQMSASELEIIRAVPRHVVVHDNDSLEVDRKGWDTHNVHP